MNVVKTLENLINHGYCLALVNNDNGMWAVSVDGIQNLNLDAMSAKLPWDLETTFFIKKELFRDNIEDAVKVYIEENELQDLCID